MRLMSALALGLMVPAAGAVLIATPASAAKKDDKAAAPQLKPSPNFVKAYQEADKALKANDAAASQAAITAAEAAATNADDKYLLGSLKLNFGLGQKDQKLQQTGLQEMLASGKTPAADVGKFNFFLGQFALQDKNYDAAIQHLNAASAAGYGGPEGEAMLAQIYFSKATSAPNLVNNQLNPAGKQIANEGLTHLKKAIEAQKAAGQPVDPSWYSRGFSIASFSDTPDKAYWMDSGLKSGDPENWRIALRTFQDNHKTMTRDESLDVLRLMAATGALKDAYSYSEYAEASLKAGLFGEVKSVIDKGRAAGHLQPTQLSDIYKVANDGIAADRASLAGSEAGASKAPTGRPAAATAGAFFGYGDNAKAATLYRLALQKGGVNADEVNSRLGIALARSGDYAGAKAAFAAVTTAGTRKDIADYWTTWLNSKTPA